MVIAQPPRAAPDTHAVILDHAERLFQEHGYLAVSTRDIREAAGVSQPTLYYYFRDKAELYMQVMHRRMERAAAAIAEITVALQGVRERLTRVAARMLADRQTDQREMLRDMMAHLDDERRERGREGYRRLIFDPLVAVMAAGIAEGELRDDDPAHLAQGFVGMVGGFTRPPAGISTATAPADDLAAWIVAQFLGGAAPRPPTLTDAVPPATEGDPPTWPA